MSPCLLLTIVLLVLLGLGLTLTQPAMASGDGAVELPPWRIEADARIDRIRRGDFTLTLRDADGKPLAHTRVQVQQTRSDFGFGTAINTRFNDNPQEQKYLAFIREHFNMLVDENYMKWYSIERERGRIDFARGDAHLRFAQQNGMDMRGHCLFWSKEKFVARQPWLLELEKDELRKAVEAHLERTVKHYKGKVVAWDVNNEMLDGTWFKDKLGEDIRPWMFRRAAELDPDTPLYVNEYAILGHPPRTKRYIALIESLRKAGAPIGGIGIQEHACERIILDPQEADDRPERELNIKVTPEEMWATLDELGKLGLPVHFTEVSAKTPDEQARADALEAFFRIGYAHERVEAILLWGFWGRRHWLGMDAALLDAQLEPTEAGRRISRLLLEEWRTRATLTTDAKGRVQFRGFYGDYEVRVGDADRALTASASLRKDARDAELRLTAP